MNILEGTQYIITIPTDSEELAKLLDNYSNDWAEVLQFLNKFASSQGIIINVSEVSENMRRLYE